MKKSIVLIGICVSVIVLSRCTMAGIYTGSPIKYGAKLNSAESVHYYSYKFLCALRDSAKAHENYLPPMYNFLIKMPKDIRENIVSGNFPKGGYLYMNLDAASEEEFEKFAYTLTSKDGKTIAKGHIKSRGLHNAASSSTYTSYSSRGAQTRTVYVKQSYFSWVPIESEAAITTPFELNIYDTQKSGKVYRSFNIKPDTKKYKISY